VSYEYFKTFPVTFSINVQHNATVDNAEPMKFGEH